MSDLEMLREHLDHCGPGEVSVTNELVDLVALAWSELHGSRREAMHSGKLRRIEDVSWRSPVLTLGIERHGGTVMGSTRAEVQIWSLDLDKKTAAIVATKRRQLYTMAPRLKIEPIAEEVAHLIIEGADDPRLRWSADRSSVRVVASACLPPAYQQTMTARRRRLAAALTEKLELRGWTAGIQSGKYERSRERPS